MASDVKKLKSVKTVQGGSVTVEVHRLFYRGVKVDAAQVIHPDIECTNGVIHVIDSVLMPKRSSLCLGTTQLTRCHT
jgi:uncharacterized surface protein with fasciclin (FAS1) repeats